MGNYREKWCKLLLPLRVCLKDKTIAKSDRAYTENFILEDAKREECRTPFEADYCRVVFSAALRRLAGKTQVHPFPKVDYIHNRLTHSLEVSSVCYSLAKRIGRFLKCDMRDVLDDGKIDDICWVTRTAGLAHDIGNPPYGHAGEDAIKAYGCDYFPKNKKFKYSDGLRKDYCRFDGNAQAFRLMCRPDLRDSSYFRLTIPCLGALIKYPWNSSSKKAREKNKFNVFSSEGEIFHLIMEYMGLVNAAGKYSRHPLSYLSEAADDICYRILDFEDAVVMRMIPEGEIRTMLLNGFTFKQRQELENESLQRIRAATIGCLVDAFVSAFEQNYNSIMEGKFEGDLKSRVSDRWGGVLAEIKDKYEVLFSESRKVVKEIGARRQISVLLDNYTEFVHAMGTKTVKYGDLSSYHRNLVRLAWDEAFYDKNKENGIDWWYRAILDFVTGMTDDYADYLAKQLS